MLITAALLAVFGGLFYSFYRGRKRQQSIFKSLGVPGPEPHWWHGNLHQIRSKPNNERVQIQEWTKKYGKIFGYFEGPTPILCVSDLDFLQQVFIKNFSSFSGRKVITIQPEPDESSVGIHIFNCRGERWKRLRLIINPTFSSAKLKQLVPLINTKTDVLLEDLRRASEQGSGIDIQRLYQGLTFDVMAEAAFGMEVNSQKNPDDPILNLCKSLLERVGNLGLMNIVPKYLPSLQHKLFGVFKQLATLTRFPAIVLIEKLSKVMEMRRKDPSLRRPDLLQMMLDAEAKNVVSDNSLEITPEGDDEVELIDKEEKSTLPKISRTLSYDEVKRQSVTFLVAGYETTSTTLSYASYFLALNPEKQQKLFKEIDANVSSDEHVSYAKVQSLPYLDMVLRETLRLCPLGALVVNRQCTKSCTINGIQIPEGMIVHADTFSIHQDPDIYGPADPESFEPERFNEERRASLHALAWIPFGAGPRNCVGLRFGMMEFKIALARVIKKYELTICEETQVPLQQVEQGVIAPKNGVKLLIKARN